MITLLYGENDFELTQKIVQLKQAFNGQSERYDAADLTGENLADIFGGQTLFANERLIFIDVPSNNAELWQNLEEWLKRLATDTNLILVEPKPDKRTTTYKWLKKNADVEEFLELKDVFAATKWLVDYAAAKQVKLTQQQACRMTERAGVNQWELAHAVDKLALLETITDEWIDNTLEQSISENVFNLFDTALNGDVEALHKTIQNLEQTEDAYRLFGLLNGQALQLAVLVYGNGDVQKIAGDLSLKSSYPLQKLAPHARRLTKGQATKLINLFANADMLLKTTDADPWSALEAALVEVATI